MKIGSVVEKEGTQTYVLFTKREARILREVIANLKPISVHADLEEDLQCTKEEVELLLKCLYDGLE